MVYSLYSAKWWQRGRLIKFCHDRGHGWLDWLVVSQLGGTQTGTEAWNVPPETRIFRPNQTYELLIKTKPRLRDPDGSINSPLGSVVRTRRFRTSGPPAYTGALTNYIAWTYPADGKRPVYTDYDIVVHVL